MQLHAARIAGCNTFVTQYRDCTEGLRCVQMSHVCSHAELGLLVSYKPASLTDRRAYIYWRPTQSLICEKCIYLENLPFWEVMRDIMFCFIQSALAYLRVGVRSAE